jgi:hypothetical protein
VPALWVSAAFRPPKALIISHQRNYIKEKNAKGTSDFISLCADACGVVIQAF